MKKIFAVAAIVTLAVFLAGCFSTGGVANSFAGNSDPNNVSVSAYKTEIVDWQDRTIGAPVNPSWLLRLVRGNGTDYCNEFELVQYSTHKWFVSSAQNISRDNAEVIADNNIIFAIGQEMANTISGTMGDTLTDGQKEAVRTVCSRVTNISTNGVGKRGTYWQREETTDSRNNKSRQYNFYSFFSCSSQRYNDLLNIYLERILTAEGLDRTTVNAIAQQAQLILNQAQEQSERVERNKEREYKLQLEYEETKRQESANAARVEEAQQRTAQVQARTQAEAAISENRANAATAVTSATGSAYMSPALAALIRSM